MSNEVKTKVDLDPKYIIKLTVTLLITCVVVAGLLGGVNAITKDKIAEINWNKTVEAMKAVVADPEATTFSDALPNTPEMKLPAWPAAPLSRACMRSRWTALPPVMPSRSAPPVPRAPSR